MGVESLSVPASELGLLASAIAGTTVRLERGQKPTHACGRAISLGPEAATLDATSLRRLVAAQASLIAVGSLRATPARALLGRSSETVQGFLGLEVVRAAAVLEDVLPPAYLHAVTSYGEKVAFVSASAADSLELALARPIAPPPAWFGRILPREATRSADELGPGEQPSAAELAKRLAPDDLPPEEAPAGERSDLLEKLSGPLSSPLGRALQRILGARSAPGEGVVGMGVTTAFRRAARPGGQWSAALAPSLGGSMPRGLVLGQQYPEWHVDRSAYRPGWCTVSVLDPAARPGGVVPVRSSDRELTRGLAGVSRVWRPSPRQADGQDLDLTGLVEFRLAAAVGVPADPRIFRGAARSPGDLSVLLLLDCTGSALERSNGRSLFEEQRGLTEQLAASLASLDLRFAVQGFRSRGRHDVRLLQCKGFDDRWDLRSRRRLRAIEPTGFTRLGAVVRHGGGLLRASAGTPRSLLAVVSDAVAYDDGYEGAYAVSDVRKALCEAQVQGIACVGLSTRQHPALAELWGPDRHAVVDPTRMGSAVPPLFRRALEGTPPHRISALRRVG